MRSQTPEILSQNSIRESSPFSENEIQTRSETISNEDQIRQALEDFESAFEARDVEALLSLYSENLIAYDESEELVYEGRDAYRKVWQKCFQESQTLDLKVREMKVFVDQSVAFVHYLCHVRGNDQNGQSIEHWSRCTFGFIKENGKWLINHEHNSVPYDWKSREVLWEAEPSPILTQ